MAVCEMDPEAVGPEPEFVDDPRRPKNVLVEVSEPPIVIAPEDDEPAAPPRIGRQRLETGAGQRVATALTGREPEVAEVADNIEGVVG